MIIVAGGDSFIWGSELADSPNGGPTGYSRSTFPALLAAGNQYVCAAYPGNSNYDIVKGLKEKLEHIPGTPFIIVCWTWPSRDRLITSSRVIKEFEHYCEYHGLPYLFTCADNCLLEVLDQDKINWENWYLFPEGTEAWHTKGPRGFYQWARENKYECGAENHPLENAHQIAAGLMKDKFNELVKKSLQQSNTGISLSQET